ncbi:MAG: FKBP-type peptidyl-prolyl cis-trans isomerase [Nitrososphaeria archaeon]|jgi:FKBP-type peptidyl-prolyl cis-trans isomerase 2
MTFEKDSLIYLNLTSKVKETNELIETTLEEKAKEHNVYDPTRKYTSRLVAIGEGWVLEGLDSKLKEMSVGEKATMEIPPEKAFGTWDPSKVRILPLRRFGEKAAQLKVGDEIELDNKICYVKLIGSGRVHVDFNHKLAGKTIIYEVEVLEELKGDEEKVKALLSRRIPIDKEKLKFLIQESIITFELPEDIYLEEGLQIVKRALSNDIFKFLPAINQVIFQENYEKPKTEKEPEPQTEKEEIKQETQS